MTGAGAIGFEMLTSRRRHMERIIKHCRAEYPDEACGILAGRNGAVEKVFPMKNEAHSPMRYRIEPREQFDVMRQIRDLGLELVGIYHSHVASAAYPSDSDVRLAFYPDAAFVIVSLANRDEPDIRVFSISDGRIDERELVIAS